MIETGDGTIQKVVYDGRLILIGASKTAGILADQLAGLADSFGG